MLDVECSTVCSREMDVDADRKQLEAFEMWKWIRMKKSSWLEKVINDSG